MNKLLQILRYIGSLLLEPIMRAALRTICIIERFQRLKIGKWTFAGSADFLRLVEDARIRLEEYDPELVKEMTNTLTIIQIGNEVSSSPPLGFGFISDSYIAWGDSGVLAAWIYFLFHSLACRGNRWALAAAENSIDASLQARKKAALWMKEHQFPTELCRVMGVGE